MSELPAPETENPWEIDHGELFRPSHRHLVPDALKPGERNILWTALAATAATVTLLALLR
jgi:hypothetical protein